jgi:large subunit ribosomal protein L7/L12
MSNIKALALEIANLSNKETLEFINELKLLGFKEPEPVHIAQPIIETVKEEKEQTSFNVVLNSYGERKLQVVKEFNIIGNIGGLTKAKEIIEKGGVIKENVTKAVAEELKSALESQGATITIV